MWRTILVLVCGCRQLWGLGGTPGLEGDAPTDAADAETESHHDAALCFGHFLDQPYCFDVAPTGDLALTGTLDTVSDSRCDPSILSACVVAGHTVTIDSALVGIGTRPLVLVGTLAVTVTSTGSIDVGSHGTTLGAGADVPGCSPNGMADNSGGGSGGSFGGSGGDGGMSTANKGAPAGAAIALTSLRGGCAGGPGRGGSTFGSGGLGGGAIYLISAASITLAGNIDASGAGGNGSPATNGGGGGGGSGGLVLIDAPAITISGAQIFANGGGGGGGSGTADGQNGDDPTNTGRANGGLGGNSAARGGRGSGGGSVTGEAGQDSASAAGGGGGGGGAGFVKALGGGTIQSGGVSPPPT